MVLDFTACDIWATCNTDEISLTSVLMEESCQFLILVADYKCNEVLTLLQNL